MSPEAGSVKAWVLAFVLTAGVGFGLLVGVGCALGANSCLFSRRQPLTTTDGGEIFAARCTACHGLRGEGGRGGPSLVAGEPAGLSFDQLVATIGRGKPLAGMPAFRRELTAQQIAAVAQYVISLRGSW